MFERRHQEFLSFYFPQYGVSLSIPRNSYYSQWFEILSDVVFSTFINFHFNKISRIELLIVIRTELWTSNEVLTHQNLYVVGLKEHELKTWVVVTTHCDCMSVVCDDRNQRNILRKYFFHNKQECYFRRDLGPCLI